MVCLAQMLSRVFLREDLSRDFLLDFHHLDLFDVRVHVGVACLPPCLQERATMLAAPLHRPLPVLVCHHVCLRVLTPSFGLLRHHQVVGQKVLLVEYLLGICLLEDLLR